MSCTGGAWTHGEGGCRHAYSATVVAVRARCTRVGRLSMSERAEADKGVGLDRRVSQRKRQVAEGLRRVDDDTRKLVRSSLPS